ncbi:aminotransferase class I/II-fold pyridoxal phosphate-dependent enzyme [Cellulomonas marina]|uniref:Arginine/lysine/ornithine decarboxylase n=1 Tax=Cellulomonas marina TaxID=988821 RepID=A0A1I0ZJY1_9CELL|nr:ornithine decarboxylase [Cellulomonas marina]GIG28538.1 ornithine decarboxylase [Cellulomonas marina]SFB24523.1 Arginine/lysine/ornithine decarboxylase [Cellulomonas marina]
MDHSRAPVLEALEAFRRRGDVVFGPPGHRQGPGADPRVRAVLGEGVFASDVLLLNGLDDRRESQGVLDQALALMADAVDADQCFFSTCGSSLSVKSAMISVAGPGEKLLVSRNAHKSVVAGLIISGIDPVWVHPHVDDDLHLAHPPEPEDVRAALATHPDAKGMLLISPTDWGTCADIAGVAEVCHAAGVPLIVDEAWGAHLPFHDGLPSWGMDAGADLVVTSVHKTGSAVEQSSCFHLQGDRIDPSVLSAREDLLGTTSSSSLVYASLDGWRRQMVEQGEALLDGALRRADRVRDVVTGLDGLSLLGREVVRPQGAADLDPLVLTVDVRGLGITGFSAGEWLRAERQIDVGSTDTCRISARITHGHTDDDVRRLTEGLEALVAAAGTLDRAPHVALPPGPALEIQTVMLPRDAFFGRVEQVDADEAVGRVCAETISPYPPGVPVLAPGERITAEIVDYLRTGVEAGMLLPDPVDPTAASFRVVAE